MSILLSIFFFVLGAVTASFMGVVAARLSTGLTSARGRSRCDACARLLGALSLVPIISYLAAAGRARCCGARLSLLSPLGELSLAALFALSFHTFGLTPALLGFLIALALLYGLVAYDLAHQILPFPLLIPFIGVSMVTGFLQAPSLQAFLGLLLAAVLVAAFLALIHVVSGGRAMGLADAPLAFGLALLSGGSALSGLVLSFWIGAVVGIVILFGRPRGFRMGVEVPFAPFLAAGFLLAHFTQWNILDISAAFL